MKKTLLSILAIAGLCMSTDAQIEMYVNGGSTDYASQTYTAPFEYAGDFLVDVAVINASGVTKDWVVTRYTISELPTWSNYVCFGVACYSSAQMTTNPWTTPVIVSVAPGDTAILEPHFAPDALAPGTGVYRYYVSTDGINYEDSIDIDLSFSLGLQDTPVQLAVSVSPNPSSDFININTSGASVASLKIVDVLGNVVAKEAIYEENKKIDVKKFRNGIYFITIEAEGVKPVTRKIIVRH